MYIAVENTNNEIPIKQVIVEGKLITYEDKPMPYAGKTTAICLSEILSNEELGLKRGDKQYISPFVYHVADCLACRKIIKIEDAH